VDGRRISLFREQESGGGGIAASIKGSGDLFSQKRARFILVMEHLWDEQEEFLKF